ncbi:hypothetical protein B0T12DRAFT_405946 [Alternaria alternata]|nr:hypothetical protein B0T12DRAFT_405946 [Alternaria alternata]
MGAYCLVVWPGLIWLEPCRLVGRSASPPTSRQPSSSHHDPPATSPFCHPRFDASLFAYPSLCVNLEPVAITAFCCLTRASGSQPARGCALFGP